MLSTSHFRSASHWAILWAVVTTFMLSPVATAGVPSFGSAAPVSGAQEASPRYEGEGLTIIVTSYDKASLKAVGTIALPGEQAWPFQIQLTVRADGTQAGKGEVETKRISRRLKTSENDDGSLEVTYRAKRYTVSLQTEKTGSPDPALPPAQAATPREGTIRLRKHTFHDSKHLGMASHTMLVPGDWTIRGGAFWFPSVYFQIMPSQDIQVTSPDGVSVHIGPSLIAKDVIPPAGIGMPRPEEGQADGGFPILYMPRDLDAWKRLLVEKAVPESHPTAKNIRVKDAIILEDLTKQLHQGLAQQKAMIDQNNLQNHQMGMHQYIDGWVMGFELSFTVDGKEYEEARLVAAFCNGLDGELIGRSVTWSILRSVAFSAPAGQLESELPLLLTILGSIQETEPWMENRAQLYAKIMKISHETAMDNLRAAAKRSQIMTSAYDEINAGSMAGHRERNASSDRTQDRIVNSINETDYYTVPGSSTHVQLPSGYDHVYSNGNDEYILTNDALFDPAVELSTGDWTAMKTARR